MRLPTHMTCATPFAAMLLLLLQPVTAQEGEPTESEQAASVPAETKQHKSTHKLPRPKRRRHQSTTTDLHKAWLNEIIDLDRDRAVQAYDEILKASAPEQPDRWIAVARLGELSRLGVLRPEPLAPPGQEPLPVKEALDLLNQPFPYAEVLQNPDSNAEVAPLRPATPIVQTWVRDQMGLTMQERYRSIVRPQNTRNSGEIRRWREHDIMLREIEGNRPQADALRALYFVNWAPPKVDGSREKVLAEAMRRLRQWIETETSGFILQDLRVLEKGINKLADDADTPEEGANNAVELIRRLPNYASKLLAPLPKKMAPKEGAKVAPK
jgi:hypothetical protein